MNKHELEQAGYNVIEAKKTLLSIKDVIAIIGFLVMIAGLFISYKNETKDIKAKNQEQDNRIQSIQNYIDKMNDKLEIFNNTLNSVDKNVVEIRARMEEQEKGNGYRKLKK